MTEKKVIDVTKIDELRQSTWLSKPEAAQFIGKSSKELTELLELGYFKLSSGNDLIEKESIERYLSRGERYRLEEYQRKLAVNVVAEKKRGVLMLKLDDLEKSKAELLEKIKSIKTEIKDLPVSDVFNDERFNEYKNMIFKKTVNCGGQTFLSGDVVTPVAVTLFSEFSKIAPIEKYICKVSEMKQYKIRERDSILI